MVIQSFVEVDEYRDTGFLIKKLYKWAPSEAVFMHLKPGQEVPSHPHDRFEVVLLPQKGVLNISGREPIPLTAGSIYYGEPGQRFGIVNDSGADLISAFTVP